MDMQIEELLPKYCEGDVTEEEKKIVEEWISQSDENYKIAQGIEMIYLASDTLSVMDKINVEDSFRKVRKEIARKKRHQVFLWFERIAAALFIPLAALFIYNISSNRSRDAQMLEFHTNPGVTALFVLPDGSKVRLNSNSTLKYPERFSGKTRNVRLDGEAYFEVVKNPEKRFVVSAPHNVEVEVLGTIFNMNSYASDSIFTTTLLDGSVKFVAESGSSALTPGEKIEYNVNTHERNISKTNGRTETAWIDGKIILNGTSFDDLMRILSHQFNIEIDLSSKKYKSYTFTGTFENQKLEQVLEVIGASSGIKWKYVKPDDNNYKFKLIIY